MADPALVRIVCSIAASATLLSTCVASAQQAPLPPERAEYLQQAQDARRAGEHARALEFSERAGAMQLTPSLLLFIAEEHDALGHVAEAYERAGRCVDDATDDLQLRNRDAILERCRTLVASLRPRVAEVRLHVSAAADTEIRVLLPHAPAAAPVVAPASTPAAAPAPDPSSASAPPAATDGAPPVTNAGETPAAVAPVASAPDSTASETPGPAPAHDRDVIVVQANATGRLPTQQDLAVAPGESVALDVILQRDPSVPYVPAGGITPRGGSSVPAGAVATGLVGVATLGAAAAFYALREQAIGNCVAMDGGLVCPTLRDADRAQSAGAWTALSDASLVMGGALVVTGALWLILGRHHGGEERPAAEPMISASPVRGGVVLGVGGSL